MMTNEMQRLKRHDNFNRNLRHIQNSRNPDNRLHNPQTGGEVLKLGGKLKKCVVGESKHYRMV